jgi:HNH endonuclease
MSGFSDARLASEWLEANDPDFWSIGRLASVGIIAGILLVSGSYDPDRSQILNVWSMPEGDDFPTHHQSTFKRLFLQRAVCAKCGGKATVIQLRRLTYVDRETEYRNNVVCDCGYPVWRMSVDDSFSADDGLVRAERSWQRKVNLAAAGGRHSAKEIEDIRSLQRNRCLYCDALFTETCRPTKDHLVAIIAGGTDWAFNLVLACRRCNSRRREIPFEEYCKLLSEFQNRKIVLHLTRRLRALALDRLSPEALDTFYGGAIAEVLRIRKS